MTHDPVQQALAALDSDDRSRRIEALRLLRAQTDARIAPRLIALLDDADDDVRRLTAEALGRNGSASSVRALSDALYDDHAAVRAAAADALGYIGERAAVPALIDALYDEDINVQFAAAAAIGLIADPRAVIDLIYLLDNADIPLAMMAAEALYRIGTPEALAAIQHLRDADGAYHFDVPESSNSDDYSLEDDETPRSIPADRLHELLNEDELEGTPEEAEEAGSEPVQFSAYYPREVAPEVWQPLKAYVFTPTAASAVSADAAKELGARLPSYREVERPAQVSIAEGALITATPELDGFQFNPPSAQVAFYEDWQRFDFKLRAVGAAPEQASNGRITFTVEGVIVADIPLSVYVGETGVIGDAPASATRPIYQSIFCSYSHRDTQIVERVERAYKILGMTFLRDVVTLKSGQDWDAELLRLIEQADIFQLYWSKAASESRAVRKEWLHALSLKRQDEAFIRPVYWEQPMPPPAPELAAIHFAYEPELDQA